MFENMLGDMEAQSQALKQKLAEISLSASAGGGLVQITGNAAREITAIKISPDLLQPSEAEALEDLLIVAFNELVQQASAAEAKAGEEMMRDMLPGFGDLFG